MLRDVAASTELARAAVVRRARPGMGGPAHAPSWPAPDPGAVPGTAPRRSPSALAGAVTSRRSTSTTSATPVACRGGRARGRRRRGPPGLRPRRRPPRSHLRPPVQRRRGPVGAAARPAGGRRVGRVRRSPAGPCPGARDTATICFSTTKGLASTVVHRLADRGLVDYDAAVATYWPEFAAAGKQGDHRAAAAHPPRRAALDVGAGQVARGAPRPRAHGGAAGGAPLATRCPGHPGYHAVTYGWLAVGAGPAGDRPGHGRPGRATSWRAPSAPIGLSIGTPPDGLARLRPAARAHRAGAPTPRLVADMTRRSMPAIKRVEVDPPVLRGALRAACSTRS